MSILGASLSPIRVLPPFDCGDVPVPPAEPDPAALDTLIHRLWDAAIEPAAWDDVADGLCRLFAADVAVTLTHGAAPTDLRHLALAGMTRADYDDYALRYGPDEPHAPIVFRTPPGDCFCNHEQPEFDDLRATPLYREFYEARFGLLWNLFGVARLEPDLLVLVGLHRRATALPFAEPDKAALRRILPHLAQALRVTETLTRDHAEAALWRHLADRLDLPVLRVAPDLTLLDATPAGRAALDRGTPLRLAFGRIAGATRLATESLKTALLGATPTIELALPVSGSAPISCRILRLDVGAVLLLPTPLTTRVGLSAYGLTPAETRVATLACEGQSVDAIATRLGIGRESVRTHLQRCYRKTGTTRQAELVRLMLAA